MNWKMKALVHSVLALIGLAILLWVLHALSVFGTGMIAIMVVYGIIVLLSIPYLEVSRAKKSSIRRQNRR